MKNYLAALRTRIERLNPFLLESGTLSLKGLSVQLASAVASGLFLSFAFPLVDLFFVAWFAFIPIIYIARNISVRRGFFLAFISGMVFWLMHASWMDTFHPLALVSAIPALAVYYSLPFLFAGMWRTMTNDRWKWSWPLVFSAVWVGVEYFRSLGFLAFTWGTVGYSQYLFLPAIQAADLAGVWLISFLVMLVNSSIAEYFSSYNCGQTIRTGSVRLLKYVVLFFLIVNIYGAIRMIIPREMPDYKVSLIQAFTDPVKDWRGEQKTLKTLKKIENLTAKAASSNPDLIVWSETLMARKALFYHKYYKGQPDSLYSRLGMWFVEFPARFSNNILMTAPHRELNYVTNSDGAVYRTMQSFNSAFLYNKYGKKMGVYHKMHLVPFGEWFPYKKQLPWVAKILEKTIASNFTPGKIHTVFKIGKAKFSVVICYEDIFGDQCRIFVLKGAGFLINTTNDYWSRSLRAQVQHFAISVFRAIENRRYLIRAANTGVTAIINESGMIEKTLPNHITGVLSGKIRLNNGAAKTLYTLWGDWFGQIMLVLIVLLITASFVRRFCRILKNVIYKITA